MLRKYLLIAIVLHLLTEYLAFAQIPTLVDFRVFEDTVWVQDKSPYWAIQGISIEQGATLTIEPGVTVMVGKGKSILVGEGTLIARGTEEQLITFTSDQAGRWQSILFTDASIDAELDEDGNYLRGSVLQYCVVEYGGGVEVNSSRPFIAHCKIRDNNNAGLRIINSGPETFTISNNVITGNGGSVYGGGMYILSNAVTVFGNTIIGNRTQSNRGGGIYVSGGRQASIYNNIIANNNISGGQAWGGGIYVTDTQFSITNNIIEKNNISSGWGASVFGGGIYVLDSKGTITNNTITDNVAISSTARNKHGSAHGGGIYVSGTQVTITNNIIANNMVEGLQGDKHPYGSGIYVDAGSTATITQNTIAGNKAKYASNSGTSTVHIASESTSLHFNSIHDNEAEYDLLYDLSKDSPDLDAEENYWGTTDAELIINRIYDFFDAPGKGVVDFIPHTRCSSWRHTTVAPVGLFSNGHCCG